MKLRICDLKETLTNPCAARFLDVVGPARCVVANNHMVRRHPVLLVVATLRLDARKDCDFSKVDLEPLVCV